MENKRTATYKITNKDKPSETIRVVLNVIKPFEQFYIVNSAGKKITKCRIDDKIKLVIITKGRKNKKFKIDLSQQDTVFKVEKNEKLEDANDTFEHTIKKNIEEIELIVYKRKQDKVKRDGHITVTDNTNKTVNNSLIYKIKLVAGPGSLFDTADEAAIDFGKTYNDNSIKDKLEYASSIYIKPIAGDKIKYSYTVPKRGKREFAKPSKPKNGEKVDSTVHTHGKYDENLDNSLKRKSFPIRDGLGKTFDNEAYMGYYLDFNNIFSRKSDHPEATKKQKRAGDLEYYRNKEQNGYVATPSGSLKKYTFSEEKDEEGVLMDKIETISVDMPSDDGENAIKQVRLNDIGFESQAKDEPFS